MTKPEIITFEHLGADVLADALVKTLQNTEGLSREEFSRVIPDADKRAEVIAYAFVGHKHDNIMTNKLEGLLGLKEPEIVSIPTKNLDTTPKPTPTPSVSEAFSKPPIGNSV
jgi:hypothetical protein